MAVDRSTSPRQIRNPGRPKSPVAITRSIRYRRRLSLNSALVMDREASRVTAA